jgi:hypothetical protein
MLILLDFRDTIRGEIRLTTSRAGIDLEEDYEQKRQNDGYDEDEGGRSISPLMCYKDYPS